MATRLLINTKCCERRCEHVLIIQQTGAHNCENISEGSTVPHISIQRVNGIIFGDKKHWNFLTGASIWRG